MISPLSALTSLLVGKAVPAGQGNADAFASSLAGLVQARPSDGEARQEPAAPGSGLPDAEPDGNATLAILAAAMGDALPAPAPAPGQAIAADGQRIEVVSDRVDQDVGDPSLELQPMPDPIAPSLLPSAIPVPARVGAVAIDARTTQDPPPIARMTAARPERRDLPIPVEASPGSPVEPRLARSTTDGPAPSEQLPGEVGRRLELPVGTPADDAPVSADRPAPEVPVTPASPPIEPVRPAGADPDPTAEPMLPVQPARVEPTNRPIRFASAPPTMSIAAAPAEATKTAAQSPTLPVINPTAPAAAAPVEVRATRAAAIPSVPVSPATRVPVGAGATDVNEAMQALMPTTTVVPAAAVVTPPISIPAAAPAPSAGAVSPSPAPITGAERLPSMMPMTPLGQSGTVTAAPAVAAPIASGTAELAPAVDAAVRRPDAPVAPPLSVAPSQAAAPSVPVRAIGPAVRMFATEIHRAAREGRRPAASDIAAQVFTADLQGLRPTAAPIVEAASAPLDLGHEQWPLAMVERIERLRDAADASDTRIRLVPEALGRIDLSVKREGEAVHVHFVVEQAATRAMLQEAQPKLAEAAEARGLKLGQTSVGGDGADRGRQQAPDRPLPPSPAPARSRASEPAEDDTDQRIA